MTTTSAPSPSTRPAQGRPAAGATRHSGLHHAPPHERSRAAYPPAVRLAYAAGGLAALAATVLAAAHGGGAATTSAVVFGIAPDLALLAGLPFGADATGRMERGRLHPRAVPLYNAAHRLAGPVVLLLVALVFGLATGPVGAAALAWLTHVLVDRACGYGLRARDGWQRAARR